MAVLKLNAGSMQINDQTANEMTLEPIQQTSTNEREYSESLGVHT